MSEDNNIIDGYQDGFRDLNEFWGRIDNVEAAVEEFLECSLSFAEEPLEQVLEKIKAFEPSVSVIGQIKAGKSTLINAIIGETGLLPSDVNPWTSVITALHLNNRHRPKNTRSVFRFFDQDEWDRLVATGGRLGEMASRAGFEHEAETVRAQISEMRQTTEERLGDEFQKLLGSSRAYPDLDHDTIDRYICYGDPDDLEDGATEGVYADLTKTADLYLDRPYLPKGLCLRDTPGVNDTFMMREQITLNAISDSRVCVVVLSAHQALSTMDLALLRIICTVNAREVLIFVNRIDELADPEAEKKNIRESIQKTLQKMRIGNNIDILFGSGYWANFAISGAETMLENSRAALASLNGGDDTQDIDLLRERALEASGVRELLQTIAQRVISGPGQAFLNDVQNQLNSIIEMSETVDTVAKSGLGVDKMALSVPELQLKVSDIRENALAKFDESAEETAKNLRNRLERAQESFIENALTALQAQIDAFGEFGTWNHDPSSFRMMMKTAFLSSCSKLRRDGEAAFDDVLDGIQEILENDMYVFREGNSIEFPEQPQHKAPTVIARTLSLDLKSSWWRKHWKFGRKNAAIKRYRTAIEADTAPLIDDLITGFFDPAVEGTRAVIESFAFEQGEFCKAILEHASSTQTEDSAESDRKSRQSYLSRLSA